MDDKKKEAIQHLKDHVQYPATAEDLKKACNGMEDVDEALKKEFMEKLPVGTYNSAEEVMKAVDWSEE